MPPLESIKHPENNQLHSLTSRQQHRTRTMTVASRIAPLLAALLLSTYSHAFAPSIRHSFHRQVPSSLCSMATERTGEQASSTSHPNVNRQLDQLAQKCGDPKEHVILLASQCEDLFHSSENVDTVSFNIVLKAWAKTCATLADTNEGIGAALEQNMALSASDIPSVPVYTARDAAERATNLLLEMERTAQEDPDSPIVPDNSSYNSVIGM